MPPPANAKSLKVKVSHCWQARAVECNYPETVLILPPPASQPSGEVASSS